MNAITQMMIAAAILSTLAMMVAVYLEADA